MLIDKKISDEMLSVIGDDSKIFTMNPEDREDKYLKLSKLLNDEFGTNKKLDLLNTNGYLSLGQTMPKSSIDAIFSSLEGKDIFNGHVLCYAKEKMQFSTEMNLYDIPRTFGSDIANQTGIYSFNMYDLLQIPEVLMACTNSALLELISNYLGCPPVLYSANLMLSINDGSSEIQNAVNGFHRDYDDFKCVSHFIYLTDTEEDSGGHIYKTGTHNGNEDGEEAYLFGKSGSSFITDPYGFHRGVKPKPESFRALLWIRYGMYEHYIYREIDQNHRFRVELDKLSDIIDITLPENQYLLRLITK